MNRRLRSLGAASFVVALSVLVPLVGPSCAGESDTAVNSANADVVFEGHATDVALEALLAGHPVDDPAQAAHLLSPREGEVVSTPPAFSWQIGTLARSPAATFSRVGVTSSRARAIGELTALFEVGVAHAHHPPINGPAYLFEVKRGDEVLYRVFTTETSHTPESAAWATIAEGGGARTVTVMYGIFEDNRLAQDGGPFEGVAVTFSIDATTNTN